jgi:hypothetical protein
MLSSSVPATVTKMQSRSKRYSGNTVLPGLPGPAERRIYQRLYNAPALPGTVGYRSFELFFCRYPARSQTPVQDASVDC